MAAEDARCAAQMLPQRIAQEGRVRSGLGLGLQMLPQRRRAACSISLAMALT
jgi:hypothetical protein